jgi:NAD(P)-dependent dehydrogenase (short-subunit alcohol dehydrogenase family)
LLETKGLRVVAAARLVRYDFTRKVAVITGAASGIGRATAIHFSRAGARLVLADVQVELGQDLVDELRGEGSEAVFVNCNVTEETDVQRLVSTAVEHYGSLDMAFNNAGIEGSCGVATTDLETEEWSRIINVNLTGVWLCLKYELRHMVNHGGGCIVNTSSTAGLAAAVRSGVAYSASKHGVIGLTRTAAREFAERGVRINAICPAGVDTPLLERLLGSEEMTAARENEARLATPDQIAETVLWLCSESSSFVNGHALAIDGGRET